MVISNRTNGENAQKLRHQARLSVAEPGCCWRKLGRLHTFSIIVILILGAINPTKCSDSATLVAHGRQPTVEKLATPLQKFCLTADELTILEARHIYEKLMPERTLNNETLLDDQQVEKVIADLSRMEHKIIESVKDEHRQHLLQEALTDVIGGFVHEYLLPLTKYAYYSGMITHKSVKDVLRKTRKHDSFVKYSINEQRELDVSRLNQQTSVLKEEDFKNVVFACQQIPTELPTPIIEMDLDTREILLITLPLQNNSAIYNPKSTSAHGAFLQYYLAVVACLKEKTSASVDGFKQRVSEWISINLGNIFADGTTLVYPAFESILRIHKTLSDEHDTRKKNQFHLAEGFIRNKPLLHDTENGGFTRSSTIKDLSIWIGCAMGVLLVVYVVFKIRRNRAIISINHLTKHVHGRHMVHNSMNEDEEIVMYNRLEAKVLATALITKQRKSSMGRLIARMRSSKTRKRSKGYKLNSTDLQDDETIQAIAIEAGPSRHTEEDLSQSNQHVRSCSCVSCTERNDFDA